MYDNTQKYTKMDKNVCYVQLSNDGLYSKNHDEFDIELLGTIPGEEYVVQTNVYEDGSTQIGREQRFHLWFDPTLDFHEYAILWTTQHIV